MKEAYMHTKHTELIPIDRNGYPIFWFNCPYCRGVATTKLRDYNEITTLMDMQKFHAKKHRR